MTTHDQQKFEELLGHSVQRMVHGVRWVSSSYSMAQLKEISEMPGVRDVRVGLVSDTDESWDGEPYDMKFEIKVFFEKDDSDD